MPTLHLCFTRHFQIKAAFTNSHGKKTFFNLKSFSWFALLQGEKPYLCDICQARFTQSNSLKAHKLIHSVGEKPVFQCELCPTTCGRKTDLRIHVQKLHTSENPIKCKRCNQVFEDRYSYKIHAKTHEGEKCYKCELCSYASISARHLESHMLIHTDEKVKFAPFLQH